MTKDEQFNKFMNGWYSTNAHKVEGSLTEKHQFMHDEFDKAKYNKHKGTSWYMFGRQIGELFKHLRGL